MEAPDITDLAQLSDWLRGRLQQPLPGRAAHEKLFPRVVPMPDKIPDNARQSAVMALLFEKNETPHIIYIRRTADGHAHSAQLSFPGGRYEEADGNLQVTALRETLEETGIPHEGITVLGGLTPLYIPVSNFLVTPYIGLLQQPPEYQLSEHEVQYALEVPLQHLLEEARFITTEVPIPSGPVAVRNVAAYMLDNNEVLWGATAMITAELVDLLKGQ